MVSQILEDSCGMGIFAWLLLGLSDGGQRYIPMTWKPSR